MAGVDAGAALEAVCIWVKSNRLGFKYDLAVMSKETPELIVTIMQIKFV